MQFTQYMFNGLVINPAYAGADEALSATLVQRKQWSGVEAAPVTHTLTAHSLFRQKHVGLGLTLVHDQVGVHKNLSLMTNYAYHVAINTNQYLSFGIAAGMHNRRSDYTSLGMSGDPKLSGVPISYTVFDAGAGIYFRGPRLHAGLSVPELIPERVFISDSVTLKLSNTTMLMFTKYLFEINPDISLEPSLLLKHLNGVPLSYDVNFNVIMRKVLTLGLGYRKRESVDFLMKAKATRQLQIGYSFDYPVGSVSRFTNGSHELMVQYVFRYVQDKMATPR